MLFAANLQPHKKRKYLSGLHSVLRASQVSVNITRYSSKWIFTEAERKQGSFLGEISSLDVLATILLPLLPEWDICSNRLSISVSNTNVLKGSSRYLPKPWNCNSANQPILQLNHDHVSCNSVIWQKQTVEPVLYHLSVLCCKTPYIITCERYRKGRIISVMGKAVGLWLCLPSYQVKYNQVLYSTVQWLSLITVYEQLKHVITAVRYTDLFLTDPLDWE